MNGIIENIQRLGSVFAVVWGVTVASALLHPQKVLCAALERLDERK